MHVLSALLALFTATSTPSVATALVGDSVIVTVGLANNTDAQTVSVDSVEFYIEITEIGQSSIRRVVVPKAAGLTTARFAYPLTLWAVNQVRVGRGGARLGHTESGVTGWSDWTYTPPASWSFTRAVPAPNAPEADKVTVQSVGTN